MLRVQGVFWESYIILSGPKHDKGQFMNQLK